MVKKIVEYKNIARPINISPHKKLLFTDLWWMIILNIVHLLQKSLQ